MNLIHIPTVFLVIFPVLIIVFIFCVSYRNLKNKYSKLPENTPEPLKENTFQSQTVFVDLSPKTADIVELAVEVWRINNRIMKASADLTEMQKRGLESSLQKFLKFLDKNEIKIIDHTGEKYNEGLNVEVLSFEKDPTVNTPKIKETVEPSIVYKNSIVKKGKIIVINN